MRPVPGPEILPSFRIHMISGLGGTLNSPNLTRGLQRLESPVGAQQTRTPAGTGTSGRWPPLSTSRANQQHPLGMALLCKGVSLYWSTRAPPGPCWGAEVTP